MFFCRKRIEKRHGKYEIGGTESNEMLTKSYSVNLTNHDTPNGHIVVCNGGLKHAEQRD